jgi:hypothetical protein
MADDL